MYKLAVILSTLFAFVCAAPAVTPASTAMAAAAVASQIRTDQDPVYHFYLQSVDGEPQLGPEATSGYFYISNTVALNTTTPLYLNVNMSATTSYKPVGFGNTATSTQWTMSGDTIVFDGQQNFLVCPISGSANFNMFLQTGDDMPSGEGCTDWITIHLDCLC